MSETIKRLNREEMNEIYESCMRRDFPEEELIPWKLGRARNTQGRYEGFGLYDRDQLCGYAFFIKTGPQLEYRMLDYYAVDSSRRGKGYGSRFLELLSEALKECGGIFLESERILSAADEADKKIRERRIAFYLRNGCVFTELETKVFGAEYSILYLPISREYQKDLAGEIMADVYRLMFTPEEYEAHVMFENRK